MIYGPRELPLVPNPFIAQRLVWSGCLIISGLLFWVVGRSPLSTVSVSYTHLDVYKRQPNTCIMLKNKPGCVVIKGTVTAENKIGIYDLVISLKLVTALGTFDVTYPGALFPGKYFITVAQKGSKSCLTSEIQASRGFEGSLSSFPNPSTTNLININIGAVSYTHLDVYKRQPHSRYFCLSN